MAGTPSIRVRVAVPGQDGPGTATWVRLVERGARAALADAGVARAEGPVDAAEISITLLDDSRIRELNRRYLDRDRPTDVIAFPLWEEGEPVLGDVYLGLDQARLQAGEHGVPLEEELVRLAVHGTLHVLGHDHPDGEERSGSEMFRLQEALVRAVMTGEGAAP